jgi:putative ATPase
LKQHKPLINPTKEIRLMSTPQQPSLFSTLPENTLNLPLAERLRPKTLDEVLGQQALLGEQGPLRAMVQQGRLVSLLFWGPPGVGKTTLASILAKAAGHRFIALSAVNSGLKELREVIAEAERLRQQVATPTVLFIDELHRYSKTQQDALLPYVERGTITLLAATTENPSFQVVGALLSRLLVLKLKALAPESLIQLLNKAAVSLGHTPKSLFSPEAVGFLLRYANGDGRHLLTLLDAAYACAPEEVSNGTAPISVALLEGLVQQLYVRYDNMADQHFDHASAYQKSLRGSDADAAIYWLAKMIAGGEDPRFIARRLVITAAEDVGLADPQALILAQAAADAAERVGWPEARIPLSLATCYVARAPKCNKALLAIDAALEDITKQGHSYDVPLHLKDSHYSGAKAYGHGEGYVYSHDHPEVKQAFLPQALLGRRYLEVD